MRSKLLSRTTAVLLSAAVTVPMMCSSFLTTSASSGSSINYAFSGSSYETAGYAEGTITFTAESSGKYKLYWADDNKALEKYYPLGEFSLSSGGKGTVKMGYHTAIPANATKIIATTGSLNVSDAVCVYDIPENKRLTSTVSGDLLYTFSTYSDIHLDKRDEPIYWKNAESNLKKALQISTDRGADYIVVSGDVPTCSKIDKEWDLYQRVLSNSNFVNPVWETDGNHDLKVNSDDPSVGLKKYIEATGTDGSKSGKSYYSMIEEKSGDMFIFMTLEESKDPNNHEVFSDAQISWAKSLIQENYTKRNIFLVEHAPIRGFGPGDDLSIPYYGGLMEDKYGNNGQFRKILEDYPDIVFLSGHTHCDFECDYNYFDNGGNAAKMIHTPALAGSTKPSGTEHIWDYNNGVGYHSQCYYTQVFENEIIFNGLNVTDDLIYPQYSYIMEGARTSDTPVNDPSAERPLKGNTVDITNKLATVQGTLSEQYKFASYDAYQALKKLYFKYKGQTTADESVLDEFDEKLNKLASYSGGIIEYTYYDTYYFVNNKNWSSVYAYAWDGSDKNGEWPGVKLNKCGTKDGSDVYKLSFNRKGEYPNLIFNSGSNAYQTVDLTLGTYEFNGFSIGSSSGTKYKVNNFRYEGGTDEPEPEPPVTDDRYVLLYYITDEHGWSDMETIFQPDGTGKYTLTYVPKNDKTFSCSIYDKTESKYYSLSTSARYAFADGQTFEQTLEKKSSRGKSITIDGLSPTNVLDFVYDPSTNKISVTCRDTTVVQPDPLENISQISAEKVQKGDDIRVSGYAQGGKAPYTYTYYFKRSTNTKWNQMKAKMSVSSYAVLVPSSAAKYDLKVVVKDSEGNEAEKIFTAEAVTSMELTNISIINRDTTVKPGTTITVSGRAIGGTKPCTYEFFFKRSENTKWNKLSYGNEKGTYAKFTPTKEASYDVKVVATDSKGVVSAKVFNIAAAN